MDTNNVMCVCNGTNRDALNHCFCIHQQTMEDQRCEGRKQFLIVFLSHI
jgi:hypothetical protein